MVSIEARIFGYREVRIDPKDSDDFANILLKSGISATVCNGKIDIPLSKYKRFSKFAGGKEYTVSEPRGAASFLLSLKSRTALLASMLLSAIVIFFMSNIVWDIRIEGSGDVYDEYVLDALSECGLDVGRLFSRLDLSRIENECLLLCEDISWININRRGTVAYVKLIKKNSSPITVENSLYSNIVASCDGIIEQIDVISGKALVKVGDVVRKGDILISGILGTDDNIEFCHARGTVKASVNATLTTFAPIEEQKEVYTEEKLLYKAIKIFNFKINIFKNYGNSEGEYDIIENEKVCVLPSGVRLPIKIYTESAQFKEQRLYRYSESELCECASYMLSRQLEELIGDGELTSIRSNGRLSNNGYTLTTHVVYVCDVGRSVPFTEHSP